MDSVDEAARWIEAGVVDVVVADVSSATYKDARLLRSVNTQRHPVPVVITAADADTTARAKVRGLNVDVLGFPFSDSSLDAAIQKARSCHHLHGDTVKIRPFLKEHLEFTIPSRVEYLDGILNMLTEHLVKMGVIEPDSIDVVVALDEAIVNAIKHGNGYDPTKQVHIVADISADRARFVISDEGDGFREQDVPDPCAPENLLRPSGRGLLLIRNIMDDVSYNDRGNALTMIKFSHVPAPPTSLESRPLGDPDTGASESQPLS
ncbi:MAG TPA: ATP-binding protein [Blastocatellia bacterium]|nr:ATP-binding protein [Blastocatellia bacterium]